MSFPPYSHLFTYYFVVKKSLLTIFYTETYHRTANNIPKYESNMF